MVWGYRIINFPVQTDTNQQRKFTKKEVREINDPQLLIRNIINIDRRNQVPPIMIRMYSIRKMKNNSNYLYKYPPKKYDPDVVNNFTIIYRNSGIR